MSLNLRNFDGKSALFLAIEHSRTKMIEKLLEFKDLIDFRSSDTLFGNTPLHMACLQEDLETASAIFEVDSDLCMKPNYLGRSPFYLACEKRNLLLLQVFEKMKSQAVVVKDYLGENMLFVCARQGDAEVMNWFSGSNNFYRARGQSNYKGQTIEHILCMTGRTSIVDSIQPRIEAIQDFYGNTPLHYAIA